jgi:D-threo-aldose 1-dehydrogenase
MGGMAAIYGYDASESQAISTLAEVLATTSINFIDTSNDNGNGESERRIGTALREAGGLPSGLVLATKADPMPGSADFSAKRVRASFLESAERTESIGSTPITSTTPSECRLRKQLGRVEPSRACSP